MVQQIMNFFLGLISEFAKFGNWLTQPLPYVDLTPLALFSFAGLTLIIGFLLVRLVVGG